MNKSEPKIKDEKKIILLNAIGNIIFKERTKLKKGINKFSFEYDIGNGLLSRLEHGNVDSKITTLWKIANALGLNCSDLIKMIEHNLPDNFNFYDD